MLRQRALQVVLGISGVLFCALAYAVIVFFRQEPALAMMFTVYATLGVFLLFAVRDPGAHRSLIAFTAWSSLAHSVLMVLQLCRHCIANIEWMGVVVFGLIGVSLIVLSPPKRISNA